MAKNEMYYKAKIESEKKSPFAAAIWNIFVPGAGYMYCKRWILGFIALGFSPQFSSYLKTRKHPLMIERPLHAS